MSREPMYNLTIKLENITSQQSGLTYQESVKLKPLTEVEHTLTTSLKSTNI